MPKGNYEDYKEYSTMTKLEFDNFTEMYEEFIKNTKKFYLSELAKDKATFTKFMLHYEKMAYYSENTDCFFVLKRGRLWFLLVTLNQYFFINRDKYSYEKVIEFNNHCYYNLPGGRGALLTNKDYTSIMACLHFQEFYNFIKEIYIKRINGIHNGDYSFLDDSLNSIVRLQWAINYSENKVIRKKLINIERLYEAVYWVIHFRYKYRINNYPSAMLCVQVCESLEAVPKLAMVRNACDELHSYISQKNGMFKLLIDDTDIF